MGTHNFNFATNFCNVVSSKFCVFGQKFSNNLLTAQSFMGGNPPGRDVTGVCVYHVVSESPSNWTLSTSSLLIISPMPTNNNKYKPFITQYNIWKESALIKVNIQQTS